MVGIKTVKDDLESGSILECYQICMRPPHPDSKMKKVVESWCKTYQKHFRYHEQENGKD